MSCEAYVQAMLEAEPAELAGEEDSPLARHIRECPHCGATARAILAEEEELGSALASLVPQPDLEAVLARAPAQRSRFRAGALTLAPLALAAGLAALFLTREPQLPGEPYVPGVQAIPGLNVEAPEGRNVAVLETRDPDIKVVWLF